MRRELKPALIQPPDFESFWTKTIEELEGIDPAIERNTISQTEDPSLILEHITFNSLRGATIHGYLLTWDDRKKRPFVTHSHGYGSQYQVRWDWAQAGCNVLGIDIRGFGRSVDALDTRSKWGYMLTGMESPEEYVLRGAVCDYIRAVEVGKQILDHRVKRTVLHGVSFAGALALMAEGIMQAADFLAVGVPTFGWAEGRYFFVKAGSGAEIIRFLEKRPDDAEDLMLVLRYFDSGNFAKLVKCPTLLGVGLRDDVVPAHTTYAIAHHLGGPHEIMEFPVSHSNLPEEQLWENFEKYWLQIAINGVPSGFGKNTR